MIVTQVDLDQKSHRGQPRRQRARRPLLWVSLGLLGLLVVFAIVVPMLDGGRTSIVVLQDRLQPPIWAGGSWSHPLGTDQLGRDVILLLATAIRISGLVAIVSVFLAGTIGTILGMVAAYRGGFLESLLDRLGEAQMALPFIMVAMALAIALGPSLTTIVIAIAAAGWVPFARLARTETMLLREREFVVLARVAAVTDLRVVLRHLLPNVLPSIVVLTTQQISVAVLEESSLSFLGLGVQPPLMSLGSMIGESRILLQSDAWLPLIPIAMLVVIALSVNFIGDAIRGRLEITR